MIAGIHTLLYSKEPEAVLAFLRDVLDFDWIDAGNGRLFFAAPPCELAVHETEGAGRHELYLMCTDINTTVEKLKKRGVEFTMPIADRGWGLLTQIKMPDGEKLGLYEPKHKTAIKLSGKSVKGKTTRRKTTRAKSPKRKPKKRPER